MMMISVNNYVLGQNSTEQYDSINETITTTTTATILKKNSNQNHLHRRPSIKNLIKKKKSEKTAKKLPETTTSSMMMMTTTTESMMMMTTTTESMMMMTTTESMLESKNGGHCNYIIEQLIRSNEEYRQDNCTDINFCYQLQNSLNYFTEKCMNEKIDTMSNVTCDSLNSSLENISNYEKIQSNSCPSMNNDDNDICPELEYSTELIHFIHYHKCDPEREQLEQELEQKQDRDQDQDQEQDQDQNQDQDKDQDQNQEQDQDQDQDQDQKLEHKHEPDPLLEKILKSSDIDIHNKDIRIKNVSESCISFADDLLKLFINYLLKNCLTEQSSKTFVCNRLRRRLCGNLHFVINNL